MTSWYWVVDCDNTVDDPLVVGRADLGGFDRHDFTEGRSIINWSNDSWFRSEAPEWDGDPDDVLQDHLDIPIYSSRLRRALDEAGISDIQYLPVRVFLSDGSPLEGFAIANILSVPSALDLDKSDYEVFGEDRPDRKGKVRALRIPVLKKDVVDRYHIIRPSEYRGYIFVSERFKRVFEARNFTGYSFHPLEISDK